jgi:hypothetical protein
MPLRFAAAPLLLKAKNDKKIRTRGRRSNDSLPGATFLVTDLDLYPNQNRFEHKSPYRERDN